MLHLQGSNHHQLFFQPLHLQSLENKTQESSSTFTDKPPPSPTRPTRSSPTGLWSCLHHRRRHLHLRLLRRRRRVRREAARHNRSRRRRRRAGQHRTKFLALEEGTKSVNMSLSFVRRPQPAARNKSSSCSHFVIHDVIDQERFDGLTKLHLLFRTLRPAGGLPNRHGPSLPAGLHPES
ncbi:carboxyl-terminal-processing peptidase 1, chloroplastic-like isoform X2 [Iris pallida]|uniref:Carboxyl-terminal-processing peptidase 1, chloroplastic-like isoform X2 n=1 Tax=Iris pallida TaxID=29817 RepID=A0AAX6HN52_IRIPA|nr:carboxyl-terminal-processing peptidase 1, chloroplastic-like isoform X2 [Iris pallida]